MAARYFLVRHADAGPRLDNPEADDARSLTKLGKEQANTIADWVSEAKHKPECVYADSTKRCQQTAKIIGYALDLDVETDNRLHDPDGAAELLGELLQAGQEPMLVAHDHVIGGLTDDPGNDWPDKGELRRYKNGEEKKRIVP